MSRSPFAGLRGRCARALPAAAVAGLCLVLTACGGNTPKTFSTTGRPFLPPDAAPAGGFDNLHQEAYGHVVENDFRRAAETPLSTFSADVNTASYSNVRRFLNEGQLPPADAVLLAEMVNDFPYRYPAPAGDAPVSLTLDLGPCPWAPTHKLARVGVRARTLDDHETPPRNLVFLVDTSGSMEGPTRLPLVKQSLALLVGRLTANDTVSLVTYAGDAGVRLRPTRGDRRDRILAAVNALGTGGGTNGEGGIRLAYTVARECFLPDGVNRVVLCTDGDFNLGLTSEGELTRLIERERRSNVFLTVLGFGTGNLKNGTLEQLANNGNGHYAYIDTLDEARKVFVEQGAALVTVAKDVKFQVEFNPARVGAYRLLGYENRLLKDEDFKNDAKDAGDVGSGHTVTALYEIVPAGVPLDLPGVDPLKYQTPTVPSEKPSGEWLTVKMRYKHPTAETSREVAAVLPEGAAGRPAGDDFRFAAAVAEFGLLLRDSPYKGTASYDGVLQRATAALGDDGNGHRREFVELVTRAKRLAASMEHARAE